MIFYFSATGNSKYAAQKLATETGEALLSITDCVKNQNSHMIWMVTEGSVSRTDLFLGHTC
jgi:flavodoxin